MRKGAYPLKILSISTVGIRVNHRGDWLHVVVETDAGITGIGEASQSGNDALCAAAVGQFARLLAGEDPRRIAKIRQKLRRKDGGSFYNTALSALEQALGHYGAVAGVAFTPPVRRRGQGPDPPLCQHQPPRRGPLAQGFARAAKQAADEGFTAVKMAPFDELRPPYRYRTGPKADWRPGVERVRAVRKAIGDGVELAVDCHSRMDVSLAVTVGQELADVDLFWYEEPVSYSDSEGLAQIAARVPQPIASARASSASKPSAFHGRTLCRRDYARRQALRRRNGAE